MNRLRLLLILIFALLLLSPLVAQKESVTSSDQQATFKSNVRVVLLDVVVTNSKDEPVTGLKKDKFEVLEDGKPQTLASFDEHAGIPDAPALSRMAKLPPNVFSNAPLAKAGEAANILLLDSLNTGLDDQSYVRAQMIKYIKDIRPGTRLAIFTLSDRLRFVQGFTEDPAVLMAAMNGKNGAGSPQTSPLLQSAAEQQVGQTAVAQIASLQAAVGGPPAGTPQGSTRAGSQINQQGSSQSPLGTAPDSLAAFLAENASSQTGARVSLTLEAINQLAMYLRAIPGRKNVIWFTGSFPINTMSNDPNTMRDFGPEVARTGNLLAAARIAIYPLGLGAVGLSSGGPEASGAGPHGGVAAGSLAQVATQSFVQGLDQASTFRVQNEASMQEMAQNTGGECFINTNGFNDVLDHVVRAGTYYYTLTYSPTNQKMDGELRHIRVKLADAKYQLSYRRGYYATNDFMSPEPKRPPKGDPLKPLMEHGTPDSTAILYTMKVVPSPVQPGTLEPGPTPGSKRAGDNDKLKGAVTRYRVTFTVVPGDLALETSGDGTHHGSVEVTLLAYDRDGTPVNWMVRLLQVAVPREHYEQAQANGVGFNLEIDVPGSGVYLRSGMYDMGSNKAGTLEIPIAAVVASAAKS